MVDSKRQLLVIIVAVDDRVKEFHGVCGEGDGLFLPSRCFRIQSTVMI